MNPVAELIRLLDDLFAKATLIRNGTNYREASEAFDKMLARDARATFCNKLLEARTWCFHRHLPVKPTGRILDAAESLFALLAGWRYSPPVAPFEEGLDPTERGELEESRRRQELRWRKSEDYFEQNALLMRYLETRNLLEKLCADGGVLSWDASAVAAAATAGNLQNKQGKTPPTAANASVNAEVPAASSVNPAAVSPDIADDAKGKTPAAVKRKRKLAEAEILVSDWLKANAGDDPSAVRRDAVAQQTGVSTGTVSNTTAWQAFDLQRKANAKPKPREVPLNQQMEASIPGNWDPGDSVSPEVAELIKEQDEDKKADLRSKRRQKPRHDPS